MGVVVAEDAKDVSTALIDLKGHNDAKFAIKSSGHDPNPSHSSTDGGVLISLNRRKGATYDPATKLAKVTPGGSWSDPIGDMQKHGVDVVGGRLGLWFHYLSILVEVTR